MATNLHSLVPTVRTLVCLLCTAWGLSGTVNAQTDGPLARAIAREASQALLRLHDQPLASSDAVQGRANPHEWSNVRQLVYGTPIVVTTIDGRSAEGIFVSADDTTLVRRDDGRMERIARADVTEVKVAEQKTFDSVARRAAPFALIGMAVGIVAAVGYCHSRDCQGQGVLTGAVFLGLGAMVGEGVGVLVAVSNDHTTLIYHAP